MKFSFGQVPACLVLSLLLGVAGGSAASLCAADLSGTGIILPVVDRVGDPAIAARVDAAFRGIVQIGVQLQETTPLRDALRRRRIRQIHTAAPSELLELGRTMGFDWIFTITLHQAYANPVPHITLSAALYRVGEPVYEWVEVLATTGLDTTTWLGMGQVFDLEILAERAAEQLARQAREESPRTRKPRFGIAKTGFLTASSATPEADQRFAIPPFNSLATRQTLQSAEIATLSLMAVLDEQGFQVAYPGLVRRIMLESGRLYLGEVTSDLREEIRDQAEVDWILTGTVEEFRSGGGVNPNPNVALGCRLLDASSGQIVWMDGADRLGTDSETVFNQGRVFSAADLTREIFRSLVAAFSPHTPGGTKG